jgi:hypothetical protein
MKVIQQTGPKHPTLEEAQDALHGINRTPSFLFGYIDDKENRVVAFFHDTFPDSPLADKGQRRLEIVYAHERLAREEDNSDLVAIGEAIRNGVDPTKR